jgi:hypothetical protein
VGPVVRVDVMVIQVREVELKNDKNLLTSCIAGALLKEEYLRILSEAGFSVEILNEDLDKQKAV